MHTPLAQSLWNHVMNSFSASANICNVMLMRNNELTEGIEVMDHDNNVVGTSKIAAKQVSDVLSPFYVRFPDSSVFSITLLKY